MIRGRRILAWSLLRAPSSTLAGSHRPRPATDESDEQREKDLGIGRKVSQDYLSKRKMMRVPWNVRGNAERSWRILRSGREMML